MVVGNSTFLPINSASYILYNVLYIFKNANHKTTDKLDSK